MEYKKIDIDDLTVLKDIVGDNFVFTDEEKLFEFSSDETEDFSFPPEVVVKPLSTEEIFELTKNLGGTISGEHGIGFVQKEYMDIVLSSKNIALQKGIKSLFDPKNILNPGKIF
mgnify:CR=1 FL=1